MKKRILLMIMMAALCTGCGQEEKDVSQGFDTVFTAPTAWENEPSEEPSSDMEESSAEATAEPVTTEEPKVSESISDNTVSGVPETGDAISEEMDAPSDTNKAVPPIDELVGMDSLDATERMKGLLRGEIITEWGNPSGYESGHDVWNLEAANADVELHLRYGYGDGMARVIEAYSRYDGWENVIWDDMKGAEFMPWAIKQGNAGSIAIMAKLGSLTRHDVQDITDWPEGCFFHEEDESFAGDVIKFKDEENYWYYVWIEYDDVLECYPVKITFLDNVDESGVSLKVPRKQEGYLYSVGNYNQAVFKRQYIDLK